MEGAVGSELEPYEIPAKMAGMRREKGLPATQVEGPCRS